MQYDETTYTIGGVSNTVGGWYVLGHPSTTFNGIFLHNTIGVGVIGEETGTTFIKRRVDNRGLLDRVYRARYVIPKEHIDIDGPSLVLFYRNLRQLVLVVHHS